jgi:hypothetical protein
MHFEYREEGVRPMTIGETSQTFSPHPKVSRVLPQEGQAGAVRPKAAVSLFDDKVGLLGHSGRTSSDFIGPEVASEHGWVVWYKSAGVSDGGSTVYGGSAASLRTHRGNVADTMKDVGHVPGSSRRSQGMTFERFEGPGSGEALEELGAWASPEETLSDPASTRAKTTPQGRVTPNKGGDRPPGARKQRSVEQQEAIRKGWESDHPGQKYPETKQEKNAFYKRYGF